ncbi:MAG: TerB family tellurite resistance protein [Ignavibacteriae bacterium]|nr:TerB family tellurite resistance protein [Ignavibacteriota bacterium]
MQITIQDKSNYFRGLLVLVGQDRIIHNEEKNKILNLGKLFGFEENFVNESINNLLENNFINFEPPKFSSKKIAQKFIKDAVSIALIDDDLHLHELQWIKSAIEINNVEQDYFESLLKNNSNTSSDISFEISELVK